MRKSSGCSMRHRDIRGHRDVGTHTGQRSGKRCVVLRQTLTVFVVGLAMIPLQAQQAPQPAAAAAPAGPQPSSQPGAQGSQPAGNTMTPAQRADAPAKGELKNPYSDSDAAAVDAGQKLYMN